MRKYLFGALALAAIATVATTVPAFGAGSGTVAVSVTAQAPAAPCLTVAPGAANFGTLPFSTNNSAGLSQGNAGGTNASANPTVSFCGTASGQNLLASTTPATGASGSWTPTSYEEFGGLTPCPGPNRFYLEFFSPVAFPSIALTETPTPAPASLGGPPKVFAPGQVSTRLTITMPCQGSNGAGETKSLTATFTAVVP